MPHTKLTIAMLALAVVAPVAADAQTRREAAVAIDRIDVPPLDSVRLDVVASRLRKPWSLAFLPGGAMLVTEKHHGLRIIRSGGTLSPLLAGGPTNVLAKEDSGVLDVVLDPDFARNRTVYVAFAEGTEDSNRTAIWKARLDGEHLEGGRVIFRVNVAKKAPSHPGGRLLFLPDKTLLLTVGDGYDYRDAAQDMRSHLGKVLRLTRDGAPAPGNPFLGREGIAPEIWTSGHRNIQGLTLDPATGLVWAHEHGPRGGDEINQLKPGLNYGWPLVCYCIDYDGTLITERSADPRFERPRFFWAPSIAPSGLTIYRGTRYPDWDGRFFVGGLAARGVVRLSLGKDTPYLVEEQRMLLGLRKRIRDLRTGPDGLIYLLTDEDDGQLLRIGPADSESPHETSADGPSIRDLGFFVGRWQGESSFLPAFTPTAQPLPEKVRSECGYAMRGSHIQCLLRLTDASGRERQVMLLWRYNRDRKAHEGISLDSSATGQSVYPIRWIAADKAWVAEVRATTADGRQATERLVYQPAPDGRTIRNVELIRPDGTSEWTQTFELVWRKD